MKKIITPSNLILILVVASAMLSIVYLWKAAKDIRIYNAFDNKAKAVATDWQIDEEKDGQYSIGVSYDYTVDNAIHKGSGTYSQNNFLNYYVALEAITKLTKQEFVVWYSSKNIHLSKLDNHFKAKNLLYFSVSSLVLIYFVFLRKSIKKT